MYLSCIWLFHELIWHFLLMTTWQPCFLGYLSLRVPSRSQLTNLEPAKLLTISEQQYLVFDTVSQLRLPDQWKFFSRTVCFSKRYGELLSRASAGQSRSHGGRIRGQCLQNFCASPNFVVSLKVFIKTYNNKNLAPIKCSLLFTPKSYGLVTGLPQGRGEAGICPLPRNCD